MRLLTLRIQNFRSFKDETIRFDPYTCLVGPNGAGKSNVLRALCVFFREKSGLNGSPDTLTKEDFHVGNIAEPIRITLTFGDLSTDAKADLAAYVRQDKLVVSAVATWSAEDEAATVQQHGSRMGNPAFSVFFARENDGESVANLKVVYDSIRATYSDLPAPGTKQRMHDALRAHEDANPGNHKEIPSPDQFYGFTKGASLLDKYLQFIYVPAVKDAADEQQEEKDSVIGKLLSRAVRTRVSFKDDIASITEESRKKYDAMLLAKNPELVALSKTLTDRIREWATPDATLSLEWAPDGAKPVEVADPVARVVAGQGGFTGNLARMGHGMQRSFLLAILQILATSGDANAPTLLLACEEPELYQHPPQIRHLASVLRKLAKGNAQVVLSTHSPLFVTGREFESVRLVKRGAGGDSRALEATVAAVSAALASATGGKPVGAPGLLVKLQESLHPGLSEMFFCERLVLVEGAEDRAYLLAAMELLGLWEEFRRRGIHIVPTDSKSSMLRPRAIAQQLGIPTFTLFDGDRDEPEKDNRRAKHAADNQTLMNLCGHSAPLIHPWRTTKHPDCWMWGLEIGEEVRASTDATTFDKVKQEALASFGHDVSKIQKDSIYIFELLGRLDAAGKFPPVLEELCKAILAHLK